MAGIAQREYLESRILSASPMELVQILYTGALAAIASARRHLQEGDIRARTREVNNAIAILGELSAALRPANDLSVNLQALYDYMLGRILEANLQQTDVPLAEVSQLLNTLLEGWMNCEKTGGAAIQTDLPAPQPSPLPPQFSGGYGVSDEPAEYAENHGQRFAYSY